MRVSLPAWFAACSCHLGACAEPVLLFLLGCCCSGQALLCSSARTGHVQKQRRTKPCTRARLSLLQADNSDNLISFLCFFPQVYCAASPGCCSGQFLGYVFEEGTNHQDVPPCQPAKEAISTALGYLSHEHQPFCCWRSSAKFPSC